MKKGMENRILKTFIINGVNFKQEFAIKHKILK